MAESRRSPGRRFPSQPLGRLAAGTALLTTSPLILVSALAIKLSSRGPAFFRTQRVGLEGNLFVMLKLRTMRQSEPTPQSRITGGTDQRIFPLGRWLRRFKLDELPQLFNVLTGDMALVGPRPEDPTIVEEHYTAFMRETLEVRPGLTCPGSLDYYRSERRMPSDPAAAERTYFDELLPRKIALDLVYVRNRSWRYDLELLIRTAASLVGVRGIYARRQAWEQTEAASIFREQSADGEILPGATW